MTLKERTTNIKKELLDLLRGNDEYLTADLKDEMQRIYDRNHYMKTAKCTDLQNLWGIQIKRTTRYYKGTSYGIIKYKL